MKKNLGVIIKEMRKLKKMSQLEMSNKLGIGQSLLSQIESGKSSPTFETLARIVNLLDINPHVIFHDEELDKYKNEFTLGDINIKDEVLKNIHVRDNDPDYVPEFDKLREIRRNIEAIGINKYRIAKSIDECMKYIFKIEKIIMRISELYIKNCPGKINPAEDIYIYFIYNQLNEEYQNIKQEGITLYDKSMFLYRIENEMYKLLFNLDSLVLHFHADVFKNG
ncbi:MAG: helix-turn-helix transcriptional regulator [Bacteroidia bacterium]|nr:helix-turn-helix transcriptional regulator [Bacteroidia bacterium]